MSSITITVAGVDITNDVIFASCSFESQMAALPGTFELTVKDVDQTHSFITGAEVILDVDGDTLYGGYVTQVSEKFAFPVVDTTDPGNVTARQWVLRGVDYNVLFDKRVLRNTSDYLHHLGTYPANTQAGFIIRDGIPNFIDVPSGFDVTSEVDDVVTPNPDSTWAWMEQGTTWRRQMDDLARWGAVYYINADRFLLFKAVEDSEAHWSFSDTPDRGSIPIGYGTKPTIGFRDGEFTEDGTNIVNDALVWGGSEWSDGIVFARRQNTTSINVHRRWQIAETHFGDLKSQAQVDARANVIVDGTVSGTSGNLTRGLVNPQRTARCVWFDKDVPADPNLGGAKSNLRPGDVVTFTLNVLGSPLQFDLPLRSVRLTFPERPTAGTPGDTYIQFDGFFGLQLSDPWWLWRYIRDKNASTPRATAIVATATNTSTTVAYGTIGTFTPSPACDGATTLFTIPFGYIGGTLQVYLNGLVQRRNVDYTESGSTNGEFTMTSAPISTDNLYVICRTLAS